MGSRAESFGLKEGSERSSVSGRLSHDPGAMVLSRSWPAAPNSVASARRALVAFAKAGGAGDDQLDRIRLAVSEAATNVVLHAYRGRAGLIHIDAAVVGAGDRDELWVVVADDGCGLQVREDSPGGGRGLRLIAGAADELTILRRAEGGTEVQMRFGLDPGVADRPAGQSDFEARPPAAPG
jgi:serine/threonine-protein kinase RsbW